MGILITFAGGQLTGSDLYFEDFSLSEALCDSEQITFGSCISSKIKFTISNKTASLNRKDLTVKINNEQVGVFRVYGDTPDANSPYRTVTAYDALYRINNAQVASWYNGLFEDDDSTLTLKQFRDSFFQHFNITQQDIQLVNDALVVSKTLEPTTLYGKDIIRNLCEVNGVFGHINESGVFCYVSPLDSSTATNISTSECESLSYENYTAKAIDKVVIRGSSDDVGASYGSGTNAYYVTGNMFCLGASATELGTIAQRLSARVFGIAYRPFEAKINGLRALSLGKRYNIASADNTIANLLVLEHDVKGILAPYSTISAQGREEWREEKSDEALESEVRVISSQTNTLTRTVEQTRAQVQTIAGDYVSSSTYTADSQRIAAQIETIDGELASIVDELDGEVTSYNLDEEPTFRKNADDTLAEANYPAIEWTYNIYVHPTEAVLINGDIPFLYSNEGLKKHTRDLATDADYHSYRFVKEDDVYFWKQIGDSDFGIAMSKIASLEATADSINQTVTAQGVSITNQGVRLTTAEGNISTQAGQISAKVSKTEGDATTSASWNLTTDGFKVYSRGTEVLKVDENGLAVTGSGTFSGTITSNSATITGGTLSVGSKFAVANDGTLTASNANISGSVTSSNATITGGTLAVGDKFSVANDGTLTASGASINGAITSNSANITGGTLKVGTKFDVASDGTLTASNANISGAITSNSATITGGSLAVGSNFSVSNTGVLNATNANISGALTSNNATITGGSLSVGNNFSVDTSGNLVATNANVTGAITSSSATITGGSLSVGNKFSVGTDGALTASGANITGAITSSNATITGGSLKVGSNFEVKNTGALTAKNAKITGTITSANATITGGTINIATDADNSIITISSHDDEVLQDLKTEIYSGVVDLTQSYTGVYSEIIAGYGSINVSKTEGTSQKTTDISAGAIKLNNEPVLTPSSLAWTPKSILLNASNTSATITATEAKNKNTLIIRGKLLNTYPYQMLTIPVVAITTSKMTYSMSYGSYNLILGIVKDSTGKITLTYEGASVTGAFVNAIYLQ